MDVINVWSLTTNTNKEMIFLFGISSVFSVNFWRREETGGELTKFETKITSKNKNKKNVKKKTNIDIRIDFPWLEGDLEKELSRSDCL